MWQYKEKTISSIEDMPKGAIGFIYRTELVDGRMYVGKKVLTFTKTLKPLKGTRKKRISTKESDWKDYYGSHPIIKTVLKNESEKLKLRRVILEFCFSKKHLTYCELKWQFTLDVLENTCYINDNISGRFFRRDLDF